MLTYTLTPVGIVILVAAQSAAANDPIQGFAPLSDWVFEEGPGGYGKLSPEIMILASGDMGFAGYTNFTHVPVLAAGMLSFDWEYVDGNGSSGSDVPYYFVADEVHMIPVFFHRGSINDLLVPAGEIYGFRILTADGIFGPGTLTISNLVYKPIPVPPAIMILAGIVGLRSTRRRR